MLANFLKISEDMIGVIYAMYSLDNQRDEGY
jgi:hypothetical protein